MNPRHSTGISEPVPAMDDDLLRDLGERANNLVQPHPYRVHLDLGRDLLASEPMRRLRAAWTAVVVRERDEARASLDASRKIRVLNERDYDTVGGELRDALAEVERLRAAVPTGEYREVLVRQRDEAWAAVASAHSDADTWRQVSAINGERLDLAEASIERAWAAVANLPCVLSAKRDGEYVTVDLGHNCGVFETRENAADMAAIGLAAVRVFDREGEERATADTTTDDEVEELARVMHAADGHADGQVGPEDSEVKAYYDLARAVIAHSARTNGEST